MATNDSVRRWQRGETKLSKAITDLSNQRAILLQRADRVKDHKERKSMWQAAQRIEDRIDALKRRLAHVRAQAAAHNQPSLFE